MDSIEADAPSQAASELVRQGRVLAGSAARWIHIVTDLDDRGRPRGFQSISLATIKVT